MRAKEDPLKLLILDHEEEAYGFFADLLAKVGLSKRRQMKSLLLGTFIMSLLDSRRWAWKLNTLDSMVKEYWLFVSHVGDMDRDIDLFTNEEYLETAIEDTEKLVRLSDANRLSLVDSIRLYASFLLSLPISSSLKIFARYISSYALDKLVLLLDEEGYFRKAHLFGKLFVSVKLGLDPLSLARLALMTFPLSNQRLANNYLFLLVKVLGIWEDVSLEDMHCPVDPTFLRVARRVGLIRGRRPATLYGGQMYNLIQSIARGMFPEDPSKLYVLRYVGEVYCTPRHMRCEDCWLFGVCKTYLTDAKEGI